LHANFYIYLHTKMNTFQDIKNWFFRRNNLLTISGIVAGAAGGFLYYYFIGCTTGTCPLTSNPWLTMIWGATVGYLLFDMFRKKDTQVIKDEEKRG